MGWSGICGIHDWCTAVDDSGGKEKRVGGEGSKCNAVCVSLLTQCSFLSRHVPCAGNHYDDQVMMSAGRKEEAIICL